MQDTTLPFHPRTGLQAVGIVGGRPVWPILGGAEDGQPPAGSAAAGTDGAQPPAATPPANSTPPGQQTGTPPGQQPPATGAEGTGAQPPKPGPPAAAEKKFTQAELDALVQKRMVGYEKTLLQKIAAGIGGTEGDGTEKLTAEKVLQQAQDTVSAYQKQAATSMAEAIATQAGIKPERVGDFLKLVDVSGVLADVDAANPTKVRDTLKTAIDGKVGDYAEWKTSAPPAASGGDMGQGGTGGKKQWTRAEITKMSPDDLVKNNDELQKAAAEGRIS